MNNYNQIIKEQISAKRSDLKNFLNKFEECSQEEVESFLNDFRRLKNEINALETVVRVYVDQYEF